MRVVDSDSSQLGIMPIVEALKAAHDRDLDLVLIAPQAAPPVCRIMDYGKFRFEQSKRNKEARKSQHVVEVKEIRLSSGIDVHDFSFKLRNGIKFLQDGNKLKVSVRFRGRQMAHTSIGEQQLLKFASACEELATVERPPKLEGRSMAMFLSPRPQTKPVAQQQKPPRPPKPPESAE